MSDENEFAPGWRPEPGDEIEGRVVSVDAKERKKPQPGNTHYAILTLDLPDGSQKAVHAFHAVLEREIKENFQPSKIVGSNIKIRYEGLKDAKGGGDPYHMYKVWGGTARVAKVASLLNWGDDAPTDPPIAPSEPFALVSPPAASSAGVPAEDFSPVPKAPTVEERAAENFGSEAPF